MMASRSSRVFSSLILFQFLGCITNGPTKDPPRTVGPSFTDKHLDYQKWKRTRECCTAQGMKVAIASGGTFSSKCGEKILDGGGNLIDAAVATAFCLAVERPHSVSIAGGGFMLIHLADSQDIFLDFRETAPAAATQKMFLDRHGEEIPDLNRNGILAVGTPGFIAGLYKAQTTYGKLKGQSGWRKVIQPAVELARNGFPIYPSLVEKVERRKDILVKDTSLAKLLLPKGNPVRVGDRLTQADLATSLEQIAKQGPDVFYKGLIAQKISKFSRTHHGLLTSRDLSDYQVKQRTPISATFRGHRIVTAPPPSAGGIMILQSLKIIEGMPIKPTMPQGDYLHIIAEVFKRTFADRYTQIGDPDFETLKILPRLNESYITKIRQDIDIKTARPANTIKAGTGLIDESTDTTHLSLIDSEGNAVSATITLNYFFGAGIMVPGTGIILNDEMGDFDPKGENGNPVLPKRRPISSLSPTIVFDGSRPMLALGAAGGPYIITGMTQAILNRLVLGWSLRDSIFAPKIHHQFSPDILRMETGGFANEIISDLRSRGHSIDAPALYPQIPAVEFDKAKGQVTAVIDPRDEGGAVAK